MMSKAMEEGGDRIVLDVHTHHAAPQPEGIVSMQPGDLPEEGVYPHQLYSTGIHPWSVPATGLSEEMLSELRRAAGRGDVAAIGETGIDLARQGAAYLAMQINAFRAHVELSEELKKPLVIHCVKGQQQILGVNRDMKPAQPWIIHGFRGKPSVMKMFTDQGIYISFGPKFNPDSLMACPAELLLAETDDAPERIQEVIAALNAVREDVTPELIFGNLPIPLK